MLKTFQPGGEPTNLRKLSNEIYETNQESFIEPWFIIWSSRPHVLKQHCKNVRHPGKPYINQIVYRQKHPSQKRPFYTVISNPIPIFQPISTPQIKPN